MKKWLCALLALTVAAGMLSGCKKSEPSESGGEGLNSDAPASEDSAQDEDRELIIYSALPDDVTSAAVDGFEEMTGVTVNVISDSAARLVNRIGNKQGPQADVLLGVGAETVVQCKELFEPYITAEAAAVDPRFTAADGLYTGITPMPIVIMYNKNKTSKAPAGWGTLAAAAYEGGVAFASPENSGTSYTALCAMAAAAGKDGTPDYAFVEQFGKNLNGEMMESISDVYAAVANGDFAAGVTLESSVLKYLSGGYENVVGVAYPEEGTPVALEVGALVKGTANAADAQAFLDYMCSEPFQKLLMERFGRRTVRTDTIDPRYAVEKTEITFSALTPEQAVPMRDELMPRFAAGEAAGRGESTAETAAQSSAA